MTDLTFTGLEVPPNFPRKTTSYPAVPVAGKMMGVKKKKWILTSRRGSLSV